MDDFDKFMVMLIIAIISLGAFVKFSDTFPKTIEGKIIYIKYSEEPIFPNTIIIFTTLGGDSRIVLSGTAELDIKIGSTYRVTYSTPFLYMYSVASNISLVS